MGTSKVQERKKQKRGAIRDAVEEHITRCLALSRDLQVGSMEWSEFKEKMDKEVRKYSTDLVEILLGEESNGNPE